MAPSDKEFSSQITDVPKNAFISVLLMRPILRMCLIGGPAKTDAYIF
jgi:hypothetical protein